MYQSNFTSPYCAAFQTWSGGISRFVEGYEEVNSFIDSARGSFAKLHLFIDRETADMEYSAEVDRVYGPSRKQSENIIEGYWYDDGISDEEDSVDTSPKVVGKIELPEGASFEWHRGVDGGLYEDFEQSIGE
jgi:hypothetical protein